MRRLQADPQELAHPPRQIEGGNVAGHGEGAGGKPPS